MRLTLVSYVFALVPFLLGLAEASFLFSLLGADKSSSKRISKPAAENNELIFQKSKICDCVLAVNEYHQEIFDPSLLMFVNAFCPENKSETYNNFLDFSFKLYEDIKDTLDFDRMNPESWKKFINMTFKAYALNRANDAKEFVDNVVIPNREFMKRVGFEFSLYDYLNDSDHEGIVEYMRKKSMASFIESVQRLFSLPNPDESDSLFKSLLNSAISEKFIIEKSVNRNYQFLAKVPFEHLKLVQFSESSYSNVDEFVNSMANELTERLKLDKKTGYLFNPVDASSKYYYSSEINVDFESDQEQNFVQECSIFRLNMRKDERISQIRRKNLESNNIIREYSSFKIIKWPTDEFVDFLKLSSDTSLFTIGVLNFLINHVNSYQKMLLLDFITMNYHKPYLHNRIDQIYPVHNPPFRARHGDLTKTFIDSLIYSSLKEFSKFFPEHFEIIKKEIGSNHVKIVLETFNPSRIIKKPMILSILWRELPFGDMRPHSSNFIWLLVKIDQKNQYKGY